MPVYSHSRLNTFENCPLQFKYRYIDKIKRDTEGIEAFAGKRVHEVLEKLYQDLKQTRMNTLAELLKFYDKIWESNWHENIVIVKKEYTADNYRQLGRKCIENYYKRYVPFNEDVTLGIEERINLSLDGNGKYKLMGFIDRISQDETGTYQIHDYKTSQSLPSQRVLDSDRQLALYQIAVQEKWNDAKKVKLIWHYLAFDKEMISERSQNDLKLLKSDTMKLIDKIESTTSFRPIVTSLCNWCDYQDICPKWKHKFNAGAGRGRKVAILPEKEPVLEKGVRLVEDYARLKAKFDETNSKLDELKETICAYAKQEDVEMLFGTEHKLSVRIQMKEKFPTKSDDPKKRSELEELIKSWNKWVDVSDLNTAALAKALRSEQWERMLVEKLKEYQSLKEERTIRLSKLKDDQEIEDS